MAKRYTASTSHTTSPIATTSSQTPSITPAPAQPTPNTAIADVSQLQVPQIICDVPKTSQVTSSPSQRKRKVYEESDEAKSNAQSQRISDDDGRENVHKTKRRKKRSSHSTSTERKSLKRKSYSNEIFALQKLDINNDADNIQDFNLNKKPKLDM